MFIPVKVTEEITGPHITSTISQQGSSAVQKLLRTEAAQEKLMARASCLSCLALQGAMSCRQFAACKNRTKQACSCDTCHTKRECAGGVHIKKRKDANLRAGLSTLLQESVHLAVEPVFSYVGCLASRQGRYSVGQLLLNLHSTTHTTLLTSTMPAKLSCLVPLLEITAGQVFFFCPIKEAFSSSKD